MIKVFAILALSLLFSFSVTSQSLEFQKKNDKDPSTLLLNSPGIYLTLNYPSDVGLSFTQYFPERIQGLQVIRLSDAGGLLDDVYFIDKKGNTQYRTMAPTKPVNLHFGNQRSSSFNPYGHRSFGEGLVNGAAYLLTNSLIR